MSGFANPQVLFTRKRVSVNRAKSIVSERGKESARGWKHNILEEGFQHQLIERQDTESNLSRSTEITTNQQNWRCKIEVREVNIYCIL